MDTLSGLYRLKHSLPAKENSVFEEYEALMLENLHRKRLSHDPEMLRLEQEKLLVLLDTLAKHYCHRSFQALCLNIKDESVPLTAVANPGVQAVALDEITQPPDSPGGTVVRQKRPMVQTELLTPVLPTRHCYYKTEDLSPLISVHINNVYSGSTEISVRVKVCIQRYSDFATSTIDVAAGEQKTIALVPLLQPAAVATLDDLTPATLHIQAFIEDNLFDEYTRTIQLHARNTALLAVKTPAGRAVDLTDCLAAWVTSHTPEMELLLNQAATNHHNQHAFAGYPQGLSVRKGAESVRKQAQAIFDVLRYDVKLKYIDSSNNLGTQNEQIVQRVRLPADVLASGGSANCLEGVLLFASLLELANIDPVILLVTGHALLGWHVRPGKEEYEFLDTTLISTEDFTTALRSGQQKYKEAKVHNLFARQFFDITGFARLIDIKPCRERGIYP